MCCLSTSISLLFPTGFSSSSSNSSFILFTVVVIVIIYLLLVVTVIVSHKISVAETRDK